MASSGGLPPRPSTASHHGRSGSSGLLLEPRHVTRAHATTHGESSASRQSADLALAETIAGDALLRVMGSAQSEQNDALILAAEKGNLSDIQRLLAAGARPCHVAGLNGFTPLHHAANRGHLDVARELVIAGANPNAKAGSSGEAPLHLAAYGGDLAVVELLLDNGASVNATNEYGETALFYAVRRAQAAVVRLLLQRGADPDISNRFHEKAEDECVDERTLKMFHVKSGLQPGGAVARVVLTSASMVGIFSWLATNDLGRAGCVCGQWHRAAEEPRLWRDLGVSRWELALAATLGAGLGAAPMSMMFRPSSSSDPGSGGSSRASSRQSGRGSRPGSRSSGLIFT
uniref:F-box domain-containing protein n=1 Tax=Rhizochromulina marina TaxID=1034831 RepID=A0A7S2SVS1_9STRA|mmetsp:Transcript_9718/g.27492  ORF Transcript_9718/g.27492 Transcript_9718/m.27492 type:complete len:345 (+) Transcript_9718:173-1207(+)